MTNCTCEDYTERGGGENCKHILAVEITRHRVEPPAGPVPAPSLATRKTYPQDWAAYNMAQQQEKRRVSDLLAGLCAGIVQPPQKGVGRPRLPLADVVYGAIMKVYTTFSGRRAATDIRSAVDRGQILHAPHYNSISRCLEDASLTPLLHVLVTESATPLSEIESEFGVDSSGFSTAVYARWFDQRWGREIRKAKSRPCHLGRQDARDHARNGHRPNCSRFTNV